MMKMQLPTTTRENKVQSTTEATENRKNRKNSSTRVPVCVSRQSRFRSLSPSLSFVDI